MTTLLTLFQNTEIIASIFEQKLCKIELTFNKKNKNLTKVEFFYIIYDENNIPVISSFQRDIGNFLELKEIQKTREVFVKLNINFKPGFYRLSFGIFDENKNFIDWADNCLFIRVENRFVNNNKYDDRLGLVFNSEKFQVK